MPVWWNGRHARLKIECPSGRTGSSPVTGTNLGGYMYCKIEVIYGVPLNQKVYDAIENMNSEPEDFDMETLYSGGGDITPGFCGVVLDSFDEATDMALLVNNINMKPTQKQIADANNLLNALPHPLRSLLPANPGVYYIFYTS